MQTKIKPTVRIMLNVLLLKLATLRIQIQKTRCNYVGTKHS